MFYINKQKLSYLDHTYYKASVLALLFFFFIALCFIFLKIIALRERHTLYYYYVLSLYLCDIFLFILVSHYALWHKCNLHINYTLSRFL